ncbi:hypothetical protein F4818DRAFT_144869 [Hypoxylon cercidicola]|nr:hypothetical protein F4818DRAFT_144869 [Hypoxylon cercidicola]
MFTVRDTSEYFPALRALPKTPKDMVFTKPAYLQTKSTRWYWKANQTAIIREHVRTNHEDPFLNTDDLLVKLGLDGFEGIQTFEDLNFKDDILLGKLRRKIRDVVEKEFLPRRVDDSDSPQIQYRDSWSQSQAPRLQDENETIRVSRPRSPNRRQGSRVPEAVRQMHRALTKLSEASTALRFICGDLSNDDQLTKMLDDLKMAGRDIRNRIEDRVDELAQTSPERQRGRKRVLVQDSEDSEGLDDDEEQ